MVKYRRKSPRPIPSPDHNPVGRPTDYIPDYCEQVKIFCAQGLSLTAFAGEIEVARSTITEWMEKYPEFSLACKIAINKRAAFHERRMNKDDATSPMVTSSRFNLVNATLKDEPKDWSEKTTNELTGQNGGPIQTVNRNIDITNMSPEALEALEKVLLLIETPEEDREDV